MAIHKISDFDPEYRSHFDDRVRDIKDLDLYVNDDKVGSVDDILVDDNGAIRYLIIHTGNWIMGKKVLMPIGFARIDYNANRIYAKNLTKSQVESLPEFKEDMVVDYDYEERVRGVYRGGANTMPQDVTTGAIAVGATGDMGISGSGVLDDDDMAPVEEGYVEVDPAMSRTSEHSTTAAAASTTPAATTPAPSSYDYDREPHLYGINEDDRPHLKLYAERLMASKTRRKAGEAVISKRVEAETAQASIPVTKERIEIERTPATGNTAVAPGEATFQAGEVARVEMYEEVPEFRKEAYVREEVEINKIAAIETATTTDRVRREEIEIDRHDRPPANDVTGS